MSSTRRRHGRSGDSRFSGEDIGSLPDSEDPVSSVIQLPRANAIPNQDDSGLHIPPPLPPKPAFARGIALPNTPAPPQLPPKLNPAIPSPVPPPLPPKPVSGLPDVTSPPPLPPKAPPPLPPKPESARGELFVGLSQKRQPTAQSTNPDAAEASGPTHNPSLLAPPTRPLPAIPKSDRKPSYGDEGSWVPSYRDDRSQLDPPQPPESTVMSDGEPIRSSLGNLDASTLSLSDHVPSLTLPLPPPPFTAQNRRISSLFPPIPKAENGDQALDNDFISLSLESAEDSHVGAIVLSRTRIKGNHPVCPPRPSPINWRLYSRREPGGEAWSVLHEYLTNDSLKTHGRNRALQLLTGYVLGACLESIEAGTGLLTEIVRRMRGAERSERDGSIFTLIVNIAAHASFVHKTLWPSVEEVARKVFSHVVEEMHGRQDDDVMWERALRCFLVLLESSSHRPSDQLSSRCLAALALHIGDLTHTDVDRVLITEGLCPRLRSPQDDRASSARVDFNCLATIGGLETILTLYADTASLSARHALFGVIYDVVALQYLESVSENDVDILKDHVGTFRALFEAYEMADCFVHTFRVGPFPSFVMDVMRMLLFEPLSTSALDSLMGQNTDEGNTSGKKVLQEKTESSSFCETKLSSTIGRQYRSSASKHIFSIRTLVKLLDKPFCLNIVRQLERIATGHAKLLSNRETMHFAREWKILCEVELQIQLFMYGEVVNRETAWSDAVTKIYIAAVDITSGRSSLRSLVQLMEMIIEFFTVKPPFTRRYGLTAASPDSAAKLFLKGQLVVSKDLLDQANLSIFTLLLLATKSKVPRRRVSECRQCLIEFLGSENRAESLQSFLDDEDAAVAYRASELMSKFGHVTAEHIAPASPMGDASGG